MSRKIVGVFGATGYSGALKEFGLTYEIREGSRRLSGRGPRRQAAEA